jgi:hypothetical protein
MGQYFYLVNLDKKQWVHPHEIGNGLKMGEQTDWQYSTEAVAKLLLGEPAEADPLIGAWRGDAAVGFVGDGGSVFTVEDMPVSKRLESLAGEEFQNRVRELPDWQNISADARRMMSSLYGIRYEGGGWLNIVQDGTKHRPAMTPDMIVRVGQSL